MNIKEWVNQQGERKQYFKIQRLEGKHFRSISTVFGNAAICCGW